MDDALPTRASRHLRTGTDLGPAPAALRLVRALAVLAIAGLAVLAAHADHLLVAVLVAWCAAGLAWGWPAATGLDRGARATGILVLAGVLVAGAGGLVTETPHLRLVPIALAGSVVLMFLLQLVRGDGRPDLTPEVVATAGGLGLVGMGASLIGLARMVEGPSLMAVLMAAVAASVVAEPLARWRALRGWLVPIVMVVGGLAAVGIATLLAVLTWGAALLLGMLAAALAHGVRRVIEAQPGSHTLAAQIGSAAGGVLAAGVVGLVVAIIFG